eukprot:5485076-Prymnesium_polylepis.2
MKTGRAKHAAEVKAEVVARDGGEAAHCCAVAHRVAHKRPASLQQRIWVAPLRCHGSHVPGSQLENVQRAEKAEAKLDVLSAHRKLGHPVR